MRSLYIGLMSGTSMDGIDAVAAAFGDGRVELLATLSYPYPEHLRQELLAAVSAADRLDAHRIGTLDRKVGECFRDAANGVAHAAGVERSAVLAIGSHGQTLRHEPDASVPYSLQIGDAATIAQGTGIRTVADFRRADIAAGGQGAPLVPPFHQWLFRRRGRNRVILNVGGIANVTFLPGGDAAVTGFDTGPGNTLLDGWIRRHRGEPFDRDGGWAASGDVIDMLLSKLLADDYFARRPPKSTGLERFNLDWLESHDLSGCEAADVQATLSELTARSAATAIDEHAPGCEEVFVCGGGAHNADLLRRLSGRLAPATIASTADVGLDPDWVEATAFAWLAMRTIEGRSGNLPDVTGARRKVVLGAIHSP